MIGTARPLAQPPDHLEPVDVGQAEVEDDDVGLARRELRESLGARRRLEQPVAVAGQRGAQEAPDLRLVLDEDDDRLLRPASAAGGAGGARHPRPRSAEGVAERQREEERGAAARRGSRPRSARRGPRRWRGRSPGRARRRGARGRRPGRTSRTRAPPRRAAGRARGRRPRSSRRVGRGRRDVDRAARRRVLDRVLEQVDQHLLDQHASTGPGADRRGASTSHRAVAQPPVQPAERGAHHLLERLPLRAELRRAPDSRRVISSRLLTSRSSRSASSRMDSSSSGASRRPSRLSGLEQRGRGAGDRGQRRAQVVRDRAEQRAAQPLGLRPHLGAPAPPRLAARARAPAPSGCAKVSSWWSCSGLVRRVASAGRTPSTPTAPREPSSGTYSAERRAAWPSRARRAGGARVHQRATPSSLVHRELPRDAFARARPAVSGSKSTASWPRKTSATCRSAMSSRPPRRACRPARGSRRRARRCAARDAAPSAWARMRTVSPLITRPTASITRNVKRCSVSVTANDRYGGTKKKSKHRDAEHGGQQPSHRAPPVWPPRRRRAGRP